MCVFIISGVNVSMEPAEKLKMLRDLLLKQHKLLLDRERTAYERANGTITAAQYLNLIIEDPAFSWLRKFSMLIVEIDEMFALKDGFDAEMVAANLEKVQALAAMDGIDGVDDVFWEKYGEAVASVSDVKTLDTAMWQILQQ